MIHQGADLFATIGELEMERRAFQKNIGILTEDLTKSKKELEAAAKKLVDEKPGKVSVECGQCHATIQEPTRIGTRDMVLLVDSPNGHLAVCPEHPMRLLEARVKALEKSLADEVENGANAAAAASSDARPIADERVKMAFTIARDLQNELKGSGTHDARKAIERLIGLLETRK